MLPMIFPMLRFAISSCLLIALASCGGQTVAVEAELSPRTGGQSASVPGSAVRTIEASQTEAENRSVAAESVYQGFADTNQLEPTLVGVTRVELDVYETPGDEQPYRTLPATTILGTSTVVTALGEPSNGWLEVMLPGRPNGDTGWIETGSVDLYIVGDRIVIDLSERELTYYVDGIERFRTPVTVGSSHNPTPTGRFFVTDSVTVADGDGPWGPAALGLSARSETITEFNGGDGIIGIHGTNRPDSIGQAASLGCVRLPNDLIVQLREMVPLGTPVEIRD